MEEEMVRIDDGEGAGSLTTLLSPLLYEQKERSKGERSVVSAGTLVSRVVSWFMVGV